MANNTAKKNTDSEKNTSSSRKTKAKVEIDDVKSEDTLSEVVDAEKLGAPVKEMEQPQPTPVVAKSIDPNQYVVVRNGFQGTLIYKSSKTGEVTMWDGFGSEQEMELRELKNAKNSHKKFFINNWFMFDEDWIVEYLGVKQYYKNAISIDNFDSIFEMKASKLKETINSLSDGQKKSVAYRANELIGENKIDSLSTIHALEEALGVELIEK